MKYKWNVGAILRTTRDIELVSGEIVPKYSIIKILKKRNGYYASRIAPPKFSFITNLCDDFEEIPIEQWNNIFFQLNDFTDCYYENKGA